MKRRDFLKVTAAAPAIAVAAGNESVLKIVDSNVSLFQWPFRRLPLDSTEKLVERMRELGIGSAMAGSYEGIFQRDLSAVNARLAEECARYSELIPVGSINPVAQNWKRDFADCVEKHGMPGIRLHPGYQGYGLEDPAFAELLGMAAEAGIFVQIAVALEDTRTQNDIARVPDVDLSTMPDPGSCRVQLLNWKPRGDVPPKVFLDTARVDGTDGIARLLEIVSADRILFGTHAPFFVPEAALIRTVHESRLAGDSMRKILAGNAERLSSR